MTEIDADRRDEKVSALPENVKEESTAAVNSSGSNSKLSAEDLERVRQVTSTGIHSVERKPFRPGLLLLGILASIIVLGQMSIWVASFFLNE